MDLVATLDNISQQNLSLITTKIPRKHDHLHKSYEAK